MKKFYLLITIICALLLVGCGETKKDEKTDLIGNYISESKKTAWVTTGISLVDSAKNKVYEGKDLKLYSADTLYLIPVGREASKSCVSVDINSKSPYSDSWNYAYVGVVYSEYANNFYYIAEDSAGFGINLISNKELMNNGNALMYSNSNRNNKEFGDYIIKKYSIKANDEHKLTDLEKTAFKDVLNEFPKITKVVYIADGTNCKYQ